MRHEDILRTAEKIAAQCVRRTPSTWTYEFAVGYIMSMVELAIEDEREACAQICEWYEDFATNDMNYHATLIRGRGRSESPQQKVS